MLQASSSQHCSHQDDYAGCFQFDPVRGAPRTGSNKRSGEFLNVLLGHFTPPATRRDYNHVRPHSSLGNKTPAEIGAGSIGKPHWGHTPNAVVASTPEQGHQNGPRLYSEMVETSGSDQLRPHQLEEILVSNASCRTLVLRRSAAEFGRAKLLKLDCCPDQASVFSSRCPWRNAVAPRTRRRAFHFVET
ncbi:hypothetical protein D6851_00810 [Altericroceibacterium spongiae]|uniref:Integrase catalytic domain-containing protein n=1 Tax=Altericroceibacterium spongiae TaxID=2320269 RepID=A0A420ESE9_9SPHN|nr:hypothetical protein D6851_00810 [Altericroceibacterium spongiae]